MLLADIALLLGLDGLGVVTLVTVKRFCGDSLGTATGSWLVRLFRGLTLKGSALDSFRLGCLIRGSVPFVALACRRSLIFQMRRLLPPCRSELI